MNKKIRVLVADDEPGIRKVIGLLLQGEGYDVNMAENGKEAIDLLSEYHPHVILLDQQMPFYSGMEVLEHVKKVRPESAVIMVTAFGSISMAVDAVKKGAYDFIEKPFDNDKLVLTVRRAVEYSRMKDEINVLKLQLSERDRSIVGESASLKRLIARTRRVAETDATVLIHGESGTGKELIARAIHTFGKRAGGPFIAVNCGAIPPSLIESELFGHEKGAFTDAKEMHPGIFERAHGGTLFLDELGELPPEGQVKLLRVLEEGKITRIGGKKTIPVDVRIIAATNRNLDEEVKKGNFRMDLLYRLNVFVLTVPPLRERKEDIPLLADHFIEKYNKMQGVHIRSISREAMDKLIHYEWPGNIRDLENAIQSAMILSLDGVIRTEELPLRVRGYEAAEETDLSDKEDFGDRNMKEVSARAEKELIQEVLTKHKFNRTLVAKELNISRKTLFNKMKRYGLG